jgi:hypothetical protein
MYLSKIINPNIKKTIAWYPSSGLDFRDLLVLGQKKFIYDKNVFANELLEFAILPDLFIHTDKAYTEDNWPLNKSGIIYKDDDSTYSINKIENVISDKEKIIGKFMNIKISSTLFDFDTSQDVLFLFSDNLDFFENKILQLNINIDFLINIRDGASENGGADFSMKFLEFFMGRLNTKYLISDNFGREASGIEMIKERKMLKEAFYSEKNKPTVVQGLKEWSWSEFGIFKGDAFLMKIHQY